MKKSNYQTGKIGEQIARDYLIKNNYQIITSNFRTRLGEIDIIATKEKNLVFVEVKLKVNEDFGAPEEMINWYKLEKIRKLAEFFMQKNPQPTKLHPFPQIMAVCIVLNQDQTIKRIKSYEMA